MANPGPFAYQWRFNGTNLSGANSDTLFLLNVGTTNQGGYSVVVTNSFGSVTSSVAQLYLDADRDGLPDSWEVTHFGNTFSQRSLGDPDLDGVSNYDEFRLGTIPNDGSSRVLTLTVLAEGGSVAVAPDKPYYTNGEVVTLTAAATVAPNTFYYWTGAQQSTNNPLVLTITNHTTVRAHFEPMPPPPGMVAWWRAENNALDSVHGNLGALSNNVAYTNGRYGQGFLFDASAPGQQIKIPASPTLNVGQGTGLTVEAWINPSTTTGYMPIAEWHNGTNVGAHFHINHPDPGAIYVNLVTTWGLGLYTFSAGNVMRSNQMQHVVWTYSRAAQAIRIYRNGVKVGELAVGLVFGSETRTDLYLGHRPNSASFKGVMDEVTIYNRALTEFEITAQYNASPIGKSEVQPYFVTESPLPAARWYVGHTQQIVAVLGTAPLTYTLTAGRLPTGLTLSTNGLISGVATELGTNRFSIRATDALGYSSDREFEIAVPQHFWPAGMVSWWRAETNGLDWLGLNDGRLTNGVAFTNGAFGSGFLFDGTIGQVVKAAASPSLDVGSGAGLTVEGWIRPNNFSQQCIAEWNSGIAPGTAGVTFFHSTLSGGGGLGGLYANFVDVNFNNHILVTPANILSTNVLQHIGFTLDNASSVARIFLNGAVVTNANVGVFTGVFTPRTGVDFNLGGARTNAGFFNGQMDEMALYNRALTPSEMLAIYQNSPAVKSIFGPYIATTNILPKAITGAPYSRAIVAQSGTNPVSLAVISGAIPPGLALSNGGLFSGTPTNSGIFNFVVQATDAAGFSTAKEFTLEVLAILPPPAGIAAWWQAESNALDAIGTSHGTLFNGANYTNGYVGAVFNFDGVNDYATFPDSPALRLTSLTLETWVKLNATSGTRLMITKPVGGGIFNSFALYTVNGVLRGNVGNTNGNGSLAIPNFALTSGRWYHLAFTYQGDTGLQSLFVDGVLATNGVTDRAFINYDASPVVIGADLDNGTPAFYFGGQIDETTIYNRALSEPEIAALYAAGIFGKATSGPYFVTLPELPPTFAGQVYNQTMTVSRATAPVNYTLLSGSLPSGLSLSTAGTITGTTTNVGDFNFVIRATDAASLVVQQSFTLRVAARPPLSGIVGWWRGETNAWDAIGNSDGTLTNGTIFSAGIVQQAFHLDGINDTVEIPDVPALRPASLTLEAWIVLEATNGVRQIFAKPLGNGTLNSFSLYVTDGVLSGFVGDAVTNNALIANYPTLDPGVYYPTLDPGVWYHVACTFDVANQELSLYVDGQLVASAVPNRLINIGYDAQPIVLGADIQNGSRAFFFRGRIDEAAIYNRALAEAEITAIYQAGMLGKPSAGPYLATAPNLPGASVGLAYHQPFTSLRGTGLVTYALTGGLLPPGLTLQSNGELSGVPTTEGEFTFTVRATDAASLFDAQTFEVTVIASVTVPAGIVSWWRAETNTLDAVGSNHGILTNGTTFAAGKIGQAFSFDGVNDFIQIADATNLRPASLTFEAWINIASTSGNRMILAKPVGNTEFDSFGVYLANGFLRGQVGNLNNNSGAIQTPSALIPRRWYHIAYTFNHSTTQQVLYVDSLFTAGATADRQIAYDANPVLLGADINSGAPGFFFTGQMDDPALYNRALTALEIKALYEADVAGKSMLTPYQQWKQSYLGNPNAADWDDADGDGFHNFAEFSADTNPTNAASLLRLTQVYPQGSNAVITWQGGILATQILQTALSLDAPNPWLNLFTNLPPTTEFSSFTNAFGTNALRFYRIQAFR